MIWTIHGFTVFLPRSAAGGLSVLLSVISLIVFICTATYQLINDGDDDNKKVKSKGTV